MGGSVSLSVILPKTALAAYLPKRPFEPCLPIRGTKVPAGPQWIHEIKHDGYCLIVQRDGRRVRLFTENGHDWTDMDIEDLKAELANEVDIHPAGGRLDQALPQDRRRQRGFSVLQNELQGRSTSITKIERPRSANQLQTPRGRMCKLRQRGREYGGRPAGSRGIDPSLQPLPVRSNCWGRPLWTGGISADPATHSG
jgi:hypothetical protein